MHLYFWFKSISKILVIVNPGPWFWSPFYGIFVPLLNPSFRKLLMTPLHVSWDLAPTPIKNAGYAYGQYPTAAMADCKMVGCLFVGWCKNDTFLPVLYHINAVLRDILLHDPFMDRNILGSSKSMFHYIWVLRPKV